MLLKARRTHLAVLTALAVLVMSPTAGGQATGHPPFCPADSTATVPSGKSLLLPAQCNDPDGGRVTILIVEGPSHGVLYGPSPDGTRSYVSNPGFVGTDVVRYKATDGTSESPVTTLTIHVTEPPPPPPLAGRVQQQVEAGAMMPGQRLRMWVIVSELAAGQAVTVRIAPSRPVERVDSRCVTEAAVYVCAVRAGPLGSTVSLRLDFVAQTLGAFSLTSRLEHSQVTATNTLQVLSPPEAGRTMAVIDEGSCTHGRSLVALLPAAQAFSRVCPGRTLPMGTRLKANRGGVLYWTEGGRMRDAFVSSYGPKNRGAATVVQPRARGLELRLAKPRRCRGYEAIEVNSRNKMRIVGRLVQVAVKSAYVAVLENCDRAVVVQSPGSTSVVRDLVHGRTVRLTGGARHVVRR